MLPPTSARRSRRLKFLSLVKRKIRRTPRLQVDQERDRFGAGRNNDAFPFFFFFFFLFLFLFIIHALHAVSSIFSLLLASCCSCDPFLLCFLVLSFVLLIVYSTAPGAFTFTCVGIWTHCMRVRLRSCLVSNWPIEVEEVLEMVLHSRR
jgi:hypothetical protein